MLSTLNMNFISSVTFSLSIQTNTIDSVSSDGLTITLVTPVSYTHYGITETFEDGQFIEIRYVIIK